jgi:hypothetical protein
MLPKKPKPQPAWFDARAAELESLITQLNSTLNAHHLLPSSETSAARRLARARLQTGLHDAKSAWVLDGCQIVNDGIVAQRGTSTAWQLVSELRDGLCGVKRRSAPAKMRKPDCSLAAMPEENAAVFGAHFEKLYGRTPVFDESMPELLKQRAVADGLDHPPTPIETRRALGRLRGSAPGDSGLPVRFWKACGSIEESFLMVHQLMIDFWETEEMPIEWETGLLKILPKNGRQERCWQLSGHHAARGGLQDHGQHPAPAPASHPGVA